MKFTLMTIIALSSVTAIFATDMKTSDAALLRASKKSSGELNIKASQLTMNQTHNQNPYFGKRKIIKTVLVNALMLEKQRKTETPGFN